MQESNQESENIIHMGRDASKGINEIIIGLLDTVAKLYKDASLPSDLLKCERSLHILETMLGVADKEQYNAILELRKEQVKHSPPSTQSRREEFRRIMVERIDICLFIMGRKGLLPNDIREEMIDRPDSWKE